MRGITMNPELVMLEGDEYDYMTDSELEYMGGIDPEMLGYIVTGAKVGALAFKGLGKLFKRIGKRKRGRVDKWKKKIIADRMKKRAIANEQLRLQQIQQRWQSGQVQPGIPGKSNQMAKFIIPAIIGLGLFVAIN